PTNQAHEHIEWTRAHYGNKSADEIAAIYAEGEKIRQQCDKAHEPKPSQGVDESREAFEKRFKPHGFAMRRDGFNPGRYLDSETNILLAGWEACDEWRKNTHTLR